MSEVINEAATNKSDNVIDKKNDWSINKYDIGLRILKETRDKVTYAGKYSERYKDLKLIRTNVKDMNVPPENTPMDDNQAVSTTNNQSPLSNHKECHVKRPESPTKNNNNNKIIVHKEYQLDIKQRNSSNPTSPKFNHKESPRFLRKQPMSPNFKLKTKCIKDIESGSNATYDLNNSKNLSQLTRYKMKVEENTKKTIDYTEINYRTVPNNAALCTSTTQDETYFDTLQGLKGVENYIARREERQKLFDNINKFDEMMMKNRKKVPNLLQEDVLMKKEKSQDFDYNKKALSHINDPLISYGEVEDLLKPGVSNLEAEKIVELRHSAIQKRTENKKEYPVSRTVSDAQDIKHRKQVLEKQLPRPRLNKFKVYF